MKRFDAAVLTADPVRRGFLLEAAAAALDAVDPVASVNRVVSRRGDGLVVGDDLVSLDGLEGCVVLGFGKASVGMGRAVAGLLDDLAMSGVLVTNEASELAPFDVIEASHPVPDERSVFAGRRVLEAAHGARPRDLVMVLISGGGSALLTVPAVGLTLRDLAETNATLLRSGAPIDALNTVRKHLSAVKGGRLAEALTETGAVVTLVLSDVVGNSLSTIASGPMVADETTFDNARAVLEEYGVSAVVPEPVLHHLEAGSHGEISDTPVDGTVFDQQMIAIVGDARVAAEAASAYANESGRRARIVTSTLEGEARDVAHTIVDEARSLAPGELLIYAGETTVTVRGDGVGGRNQELALAASIEMDGDDDLVLLSFGTDGIDGMNPAAGAFADGLSISRGRNLGMDARDYLERNDSHTYLSATGDTVVCGPTGTNVGDVILVYRGGERP